MKLRDFLVAPDGGGMPTSCILAVQQSGFRGIKAHAVLG